MVIITSKNPVQEKNIFGYVVFSKKHGKPYYDLAFTSLWHEPKNYAGYKLSEGSEIVFSYEDDEGFHNNQIYLYNEDRNYFNGITVFTTLEDATAMADLLDLQYPYNEHKVFTCEVSPSAIENTFLGRFGFGAEEIQYHGLCINEKSLSECYITSAICLRKEMWTSRKGKVLADYILPKFKEPVITNECAIGFILLSKTSDGCYEPFSGVRLSDNMDTIGTRYNAPDKELESKGYELGIAHTQPVYYPRTPMPIIFPSLNMANDVKDFVHKSCQIYTVCLQSGDIMYRAGEKDEAIYYGYGSGFISLGLSHHQNGTPDRFSVDGSIRTLLQWSNYNKNI